MEQSRISRREFVGALGTALAGLSAFTIVPRHAVAASGMVQPGEKLNIAGIGLGSQGTADINQIARDPGVNIVALCDVDQDYAAPTCAKYPKARRFTDFRKMLDVMGPGIDAVVVGTPDHIHTIAALAAMQHGKHVYCEKPLAHSIGEVRRLMAAAKQSGVVTQLGNQGHSFDSIRIFYEWIHDGAIGGVHTIHCGCNSVYSEFGKLAAVRDERPPIPATLDWDLWLGPVAKRPYHPAFHPRIWRPWVPFGTGVLGDWACHVIDPVFWALDLGAPATIQAEVKGYDIKTQGLLYPAGEIITYEFPAKGARGPVTLKWFSGTERVPRPPELEPGRKDIEIGAAVYGDKGTITYGSHGAGSLRIIPEKKMQEYKRPPATLPRVKGHHEDWLAAIRTGGKAGSDFAAYGGPLTEIPLLGIIAVKLAGTRLEWDGEGMRFRNSEAANALLKPEYQNGWVL